MTTFYIARHGQTEWNVEGRLQGHTNSHLTAQGRQQAELLRDTLADVTFDAIVSSDLTRAHDTAEIIAQSRNVTVTTTLLLREKGFGHLEGKLSNHIREEGVWDTFNTLDYAGQLNHRLVPGAETIQEMLDRFRSFLLELAQEYPDGTILVVSHGGAIRAFIADLHITFQDVPAGTIKNTGFLTVESDGKDFSHLDISNL